MAQSGTTTVYTDVSQLKGTDISDESIFTDGTRPGEVKIDDATGTVLKAAPTDDEAKKIFFLYNVGTGRVLHSGDVYGTIAVLASTGHYLWLEKSANSTTPQGGDYFIHSSLTTLNDNGSGDNYGYLRIGAAVSRTTRDGKTVNPQPNGIWMDNNRSQANTGWSFVKVNTDYYKNQNVYAIYDTYSSDKRFIGAAPDFVTDNHNIIQIGYNTRNDITGTEITDSVSANLDANYYWKLISLYDYEQMFNTQQSQLTHSLDATFLLLDPSFHVNNRAIRGWQATDNNGFTFGTEYIYKTYSDRANNQYTNYNDQGGNVQRDYGQYYYAYTHSSAAQTLYQDVTVDRAGWYIVGCNGFSTLNYVSDSENRNTATLFAQKGTDESTRVAQALNGISAETAASLMAAPNNHNQDRYRGVNAGVAFANGQYSNQVMIRVTKDDIKDGSATIRLGYNITVPSTSAANATTRAAADAATPWTAFDNTTLSYLGENEAPDLILSEEDISLDTLKNTTDTYKNATLHLKRTFTLGKWNTIVLPVTLTASQVKEAFGEDTELAYLRYLTNTSMRFERVDLDNEGMEAYRPYIIKPSKDAGTTPAYVATLSSTTNSTYNNIEKHVGSNHYLISMVDFNRDDLNSNVNDAWMVNSFTTGGSATTSDNTLTAYGTLAKTYADGKIIDGRDNLAGAYYMNKGAMWQVPSDKQYGMKAFRLWFKLNKAQTPAQAKVSAYVDNDELEIHDNGTTTGIDGITFTEPQGVYSNTNDYTDGVYTITGQRVRENASIDGLPSGLYVVAGKKVLVK